MTDTAENTSDGSPSGLANPPESETSAEPAALYRVDGNVAVITLNRPNAMNAVNSALSSAVGEALEEADADPQVRAVIVTGAGRAFCAGADLKELAQRRPIYAEGHAEWGFAGLTRHWISKPVIAAVNGFAMGGGTELALACDLVVSADTAAFGLPEVKRGLMAAAGGVTRLQRQVPIKRALQMALTGEPVDAETACDWGLVNTVTPADQVLDVALDLARKIARNAPLSLRATKEMIYRTAVGESDWNTSWGGDPWEANEQIRREVFASDDALEGPRAFAQKREPQWQGR